MSAVVTRSSGGDALSVKKRKFASSAAAGTDTEVFGAAGLAVLAELAARSDESPTPPMTPPGAHFAKLEPTKRPRSNPPAPTTAAPISPAFDTHGSNASPVMKWKPYCPTTWHHIHDQSGTNLGLAQFTLDVEKGFVYSPVDKAFICQKKNHFQMSVKFAPIQNAFVKLPNGKLVTADNLFLCVHGLKCENRGSVVTIEQSRRPDRTRHPLSPIAIGKASSSSTQKLTVPRLHFSETTANNMRKKGKQNPNQRYFSLVITVAATVNGRSYPLCALESERIIVRAANLNIFVESETPQQWVNAAEAKAISYLGRVGINTDAPTEALAVHGNVQVSGAVLQPSDRRLKENIVAINSRQQLENIKQVSIYKYDLKDAWAQAAGREASKSEFGVLAQELQRILPDAVRETGQSVLLGEEGVLENLLVVNKERLFMENVGAVKELGRLTAALEQRLRNVEASSPCSSKVAEAPGPMLDAVAAATPTLVDMIRPNTVLIFLLGMMAMFCLMLMYVVYMGQLGHGHGCMMFADNNDTIPL